MMKTLTRWGMVAMLMVVGCFEMRAQIPAEVSEVMRKCSEKMENPAGVEVDMKIEGGMLVFKMRGQVTLSTKGDKEYVKGSITAMGMTEPIEEGFDGQYEWRYKKVGEMTKKSIERAQKKGKKVTEVRDSLIIKKADKKSKKDDDYSLDFDLDKEYRKAKMKEEGRYYVITFSDRISKDSPKKTTVKIDKEKYYMREMSASQSGLKMTITVTRVKIGVRDELFTIDPSKYPGAVVVRK